MNIKKVTVIGSGLGGLSAAISLAVKGFEVDVFEKNDKVGGKLNSLTQQGFQFDLGPSILTLPHIFEQLFTSAHKNMADYVPIEPVLPHWRNFYQNGSSFDFHPDIGEMKTQLNKLGKGTDGFFEFLEYSRRQFELCKRGFFDKGYDTFSQVLKGYGLADSMRFDLLRSMDTSVRKYVSNPELVEALNYFAKYLGSSPYDAPGLLNLLVYLQFGYGLWYVTGGMYNLARGLQKLAMELGVRFHLNQEVVALHKENNRICRVQCKEGNCYETDAVVCNMEVIPAYRRLLGENEAWLNRLEKRFEPACSGLVLHLGIEGCYEQLAHHNFFYSDNSHEHFDCIFHRHTLSPDPTIYLVAPVKTDKTLAPKGCEIIKILPHITHLDDQHPLTQEDYSLFQERVLDKLERMGLKDLRKRTVVQQALLPADIERMYYSNKGSIYGIVSDRWKNQAFRLPKLSPKYDNLYFVGGSVNPGCGMPMVSLSGQLAAETLYQKSL